MTTSGSQPPSADDCRQRFLIAIAKLLGESPIEADPLGSIRVCEAWVFDETVGRIVRPDGTLALDRDIFNRLMLQCGKRRVTEDFYQAFFAQTHTIEQFETDVERYRIKCMLLYGNFKYAYRTFATAGAQKLQRLLAQTEPIDELSFTQRPGFDEIQPIEPDELYLLGYIARGHQEDLQFCVDLFDVFQNTPNAAASKLGELSRQKQEKVDKALKQDGLTFEPDRIAEAAYLSDVTERLRQALKGMEARSSAAIRIGEQNTARYLSLRHLDVYVATSMRSPEDFIAQHRFICQVFGHADIKPLKLRYFDPTLSYVKNRITKGLVEALMLRRARATIYNAGQKDTLGKDCELAATLAQGKPVVVYVPVGRNEAENDELNTRAKNFLVDHPLGLQIDVNTGVAHGIIVVRSPDECARVLRALLLNRLDLKISHEGGNYLLSEANTNSVIRVVSDDPFLTHVFWTYFHDNRRRESVIEPRASDRSAMAGVD